MKRLWKKKVIVLTLWILGVLGGGNFTAWTEPDSPEFTLSGLAQSCPTPEALARFLKREIRFQKDRNLFGQPDYWQGPEESLARRGGDCEDYAILAQAVFTLQGKEAFLLSLYGPHGYAHTVCVFIEEGRYNLINEDRLLRYRAQSIQELATFLYPAWRWAAVAERKGYSGRMIREIRNPSPLPFHSGHPVGSLSSEPLY